MPKDDGKTKGIISLEKLRDGTYDNIPRHILEDRLSGIPTSVADFIVEENKIERSPGAKYIAEKLDIMTAHLASYLGPIKNADPIIGFNFTAMEAIIYLGLDDRLVKRGFSLPKKYKWLEEYVKVEVLERRASISKQLRNPRTPNQIHHWIILAEENGVPCYASLSLV